MAHWKSPELIVGVGVLEHLEAVVAPVVVGIRLLRIRAVDVGFVVVEQPVLVGVWTLVGILLLFLLLIRRRGLDRRLLRIEAQRIESIVRVDVLRVVAEPVAVGVFTCSGST